MSANGPGKYAPLSSIDSVETPNVLNEVTVLTFPLLALQDVSLTDSSGNVSSTSRLTDKISSVNKNIYVCTFCQVFSPSESVVVDHINASHSDSFLVGTTAEHFVSKLQALKNDCNKAPRKVGRPKKEEKQSTTECIEETIPTPDPIPDSNGLYWCKTCKRSFKKLRQLSQHICPDTNSENDLSLDSDTDSNFSTIDDHDDFQTFMAVEPSPWFRIPKRKNAPKHSNQDLLTPENNVGIDQVATECGNQMTQSRAKWRSDPAYLPLFENEKEKEAFEIHLRSIDCSFVDNLFIKNGSQSKSRKRSSQQNNISSFSCIICLKVFHSLTHIRMHCLTHTDVKPFTCPKCSYCSNTKGSLYTHMRIHTGTLFQCSQCEFKCSKRAHLLDHEETHSSVIQICKMCKNSYKTVRSLREHVRKYHNTPRGRKYAKSFSSKRTKSSFIKCDICQKRYKSQTSFEMHNQTEHTVISSIDDAIHPVFGIPVTTETSEDTMQMNPLQVVPIPSAHDENYDNESVLTELVLKELLQQKDEGTVHLYDDVFPPSPNSLVPTANSTNSFSSKNQGKYISSINSNNQYETHKGVLAGGEKSLPLDILDECLRESRFPEDMIVKPTEESVALPSNCDQSFGIHGMQLPYPAESLVNNNLSESVVTMSKDVSELGSGLLDKNDLSEPKSAEIKLFEKCRRAPAYVCCVCSGIFICPITLRAHLKEHINTNNSLVEQAVEDFVPSKEPETDLAVDNVCKILQDAADSITDEEELEKLYSSSLDMLFYLPEVSVVLENDPTLASVLDDISNFPITADDLEMKCDEMFST